MVNNTLSSYAASTASVQAAQQNTNADIPLLWKVVTQPAPLVFVAAVFLVSVPVFIEAPLVRMLPWLSFALTGGWVWLSLKLMSRPATYVWGDLLLGFSWRLVSRLNLLGLVALGTPVAFACRVYRFALRNMVFESELG